MCQDGDSPFVSKERTVSGGQRSFFLTHLPLIFMKLNYIISAVAYF